MKVVRSNTFETNSSSVHAVCVGPDVAGNKVIDHYAGYEGKTFEITLCEFGWDGECSTVNEKIAYLLLYIWHSLDFKFRNDKEMLKRLDNAFIWYPNNEREYVEALALVESTEEYARIERIVKEKTGCDKMIIRGTGYIDHQSTETWNTLDEWLDAHGIDTDEKLATFIFGESYIEIDNDNH